MTAIISTRNAGRMAGFFVKNNSEQAGKMTSYVLKTEVSYPQKAVKEVKA